MDREVTLKVTGLAAGMKYRLRHYRVDNNHSNIYAAWVALGKPDWPKPVPLADLRQHDRLDVLHDDKEIIVNVDGAAELQFTLPMPGLSLVIFSPVSAEDEPVELRPVR